MADGFNASTDIFNFGANWKVRSSNENKSASVAECQNCFGDVTHRDKYAERIAPTADYVLGADVTSIPSLGTVVDVGGKKVAINSITINTSRGAAVSASVSGVQVSDGATTGRTYACGVSAISARHRAQDILGLLGETMPETVTEASFAFSCDVTPAEPKGEIVNFDVSNGRVVASYTHTVGDGSTVAAPAVTGNAKVVSSPASKSCPENDYTQTTYSITNSLVGTDAA